MRQEAVRRCLPDHLRDQWECIQDTSADQHPYDLALLYDSTQLTPISFKWLGASLVRRRIRPGLVVAFETQDAGPLVVAIAHWPSNMGDTEQAEALRSKAAEALRDQLADATFGDKPVIVMGDLNLEPFATPLHAAFPTSRYRDIVVRHLARDRSDSLFYNPSWRWLGERYPWAAGEGPPSMAGTYRGRDSTPSSWRTFDQILVSPSLLRGTGWTLSERSLGVWDDALVYDAIKSRPREPFDHLPILGSLDWTTITSDRRTMP